MLARAHRITSGDDYRFAVRKGVRAGTRGLTVSVAPRPHAALPTRFGFIVSKRVGIAVARNTMRRRLKAISLELLTDLPSGLDVVYRMHPESADWRFDQLRANARDGVGAALRKLERSRA